MNHPGGARLEPSPAETDRLLQALLWVCNSHGIQKSHASFLAGLPAMGKLSVEHGVRAMQASGFSVKLAKRDPASLPIEIYPVVLLLKDGGALILLDRTTSVRGPRYELLQAGLDEQRFFLEESEETFSQKNVASQGYFWVLQENIFLENLKNFRVERIFGMFCKFPKNNSRDFFFGRDFLFVCNDP